MANVKKILIEGELPFYWIETISGDTAGLILSWLYSPATNLTLTYGETRQAANEHGGITTYYRFKVEGSEAMSYPTLERLIDTFSKCGTVSLATIDGKAFDIADDDNTDRFGNVLL